MEQSPTDHDSHGKNEKVDQTLDMSALGATLPLLSKQQNIENIARRLHSMSVATPTLLPSLMSVIVPPPAQFRSKLCVRCKRKLRPSKFFRRRFPQNGTTHISTPITSLALPSSTDLKGEGGTQN